MSPDGVAPTVNPHIMKELRIVMDDEGDASIRLGRWGVVTHEGVERGRTEDNASAADRMNMTIPSISICGGTHMRILRYASSVNSVEAGRVTRILF